MESGAAVLLVVLGIVLTLLGWRRPVLLVLVLRVRL